MSEPFSLLSVWTLIKTLTPNIIGGAIALWKVKEEVNWRQKSIEGKVFTVLFTPIVFAIALLVGHYFGGAIVEVASSFVEGAENPFTYALIMLLTTASSLRFLRMFMVRIEEIFELIFIGIKSSIKRFFKIEDTSNQNIDYKE